MENPFGITREEVLELAANKLVEAFADDAAIEQKATRKIEEQVKNLFASGLKDRIDAFLDEEMKRTVGQEVVPVNIWGDREGKPTTIRAALAQRAKDFWNVKVNEDGRESSYGGEERSKVMMRQILRDEFTKAVKENAEVIIGEFKAAITADSTKLVTDHINKLIQVKSR